MENYKTMRPARLNPARIQSGGRSGGEETVRPYINKAILTLTPHQTLHDACRLMIQNRIGCVVITAGNQPDSLPDGQAGGLAGKPIGIVSESTIVRQVAFSRNLNTELGEIMSKRIISIHPDKTVSEALELMHRYHIRRLPVIENGILTGIVTQTDLLEVSCRLMNSFKTRHKNLSEIASRDELTGLYNRRYFKEAFHNELSRTRSFGGLLSVVLIDIDHFKHINDTFGHNTGDYAMQEVASIIKDNAREVDIVARYGGDEFAVLLPGVGTRAAYLFAEQVRRIIETTPFTARQENLKLTISGGVCKWTKELNSITSMINEADKYLYEAKRSGRNKIIVAE